MISLEAHAQGVILTVRAQPAACKSGILGEHAGMLKIAVTAAPEKGKANQAVIDVLCQALNLRKSQVTLLGGETARQKRFLLSGLAPAEAEKKIALLLAK